LVPHEDVETVPALAAGLDAAEPVAAGALEAAAAPLLELELELELQGARTPATARPRRLPRPACARMRIYTCVLPSRGNNVSFASERVRAPPLGGSAPSGLAEEDAVHQFHK
jgi:hypothetical protein